MIWIGEIEIERFRLRGYCQYYVTPPTRDVDGFYTATRDMAVMRADRLVDIYASMGMETKVAEIGGTIDVNV